MNRNRLTLLEIRDNVAKAYRSHCYAEWKDADEVLSAQYYLQTEVKPIEETEVFKHTEKVSTQTEEEAEDQETSDRNRQVGRETGGSGWGECGIS